MKEAHGLACTFWSGALIYAYVDRTGDPTVHVIMFSSGVLINATTGANSVRPTSSGRFEGPIRYIQTKILIYLLGVKLNATSGEIFSS